MSHADVPIQPAATVVCLRDAPAGLEVLLVRRNAKLVFHGGAWVFPGGRVDAKDAGGDGDVRFEESAARRAAVRETQEETSLRVEAGSLVPVSHWTTPPGFPRRFSTWFFLVDIHDGVVAVDRGEIEAPWWVTPAEALAQQAAGTIELPPPTFVSLVGLATQSAVEDAMQAARGAGIERYVPRLIRRPDGAVSLYTGDAGYEARDPDRGGKRHRLWMLRDGWRYERHD